MIVQRKRRIRLGIYSVPFWRRIRNCSGERMTFHSSSVFWIGVGAAIFRWCYRLKKAPFIVPNCKKNSTKKIFRENELGRKIGSGRWQWGHVARSWTKTKKTKNDFWLRKRKKVIPYCLSDRPNEKKSGRIGRYWPIGAHREGPCYSHPYFLYFHTPNFLVLIKIPISSLPHNLFPSHSLCLSPLNSQPLLETLPFPFSSLLHPHSIWSLLVLVTLPPVFVFASSCTPFFVLHPPLANKTVICFRHVL